MVAVTGPRHHTDALANKAPVKATPVTGSVQGLGIPSIGAGGSVQGHGIPIAAGNPEGASANSLPGTGSLFDRTV